MPFKKSNKIQDPYGLVPKTYAAGGPPAPITAGLAEGIRLGFTHLPNQSGRTRDQQRIEHEFQQELAAYDADIQEQNMVIEHNQAQIDAMRATITVSNTAPPSGVMNTQETINAGINRVADLVNPKPTGKGNPKSEL